MADNQTCPPLGTGSIDFAKLHHGLSAKGKINPAAVLESARVPATAPLDPPAVTPAEGDA